LICLINHALMQEHPSLPDMSISISWNLFNHYGGELLALSVVICE
jgi:hypothetical protein